MRCQRFSKKVFDRRDRLGTKGDMPREPKAISVIPSDAETDELINELCDKLRTSRAGFAAIALDFAAHGIEAGAAKIENGHLIITDVRKLKAA